jgi:Spy/CpxP family protein refolding chaperone
MRLSSFIFMMGFAVPILALAQTPSAPYVGQQTRTIKALSEDDIAALLKGEGMGMAKAAELNGYPGPAHVLALAKELKLTDEQRQQVQAIFDQMHTRAVMLGKEIVERERALDQQFAKSEVTSGDVAAETAKIAALQGQLRSAHLEAHLATRPLLNAEQLKRYQQLRGYGGREAPTHHHHG